MAGEPRGELAEAIAKVAVEKAVALLGKGETIFWEVSPQGSVICPDLTTGMDADEPTNVILVNASDNVSNSHMKYWRNVAEIFDSKSRLDSPPAVLNLVFKSAIKPELIGLTAALCDATHLVDRDAEHGPDITRWLEANHPSAPSTKSGKEARVREAVSPTSSRYDPSFAAALDSLTATLAGRLYVKNTSLDPLWSLVRQDYVSRAARPVRAARTTMLRRGLARWLVIEDSIRRDVLRAHLRGKPFLSRDAPTYLEDLGLLMRRMSAPGGPNRYYIPPPVVKGDMVKTVSRDLREAAAFFLNAASGDVDRAVDALMASFQDVPAEMVRAAAQLRAMPGSVKSWHAYVLANWSALCTPEGAYEHLVRCYQDPTMGGQVPASGDTRVWLYDHLVAILRSNRSANNDFGYGAMVSTFKSKAEDPLLKAFFETLIAQLAGRELKTARRWVDGDFRTAAEPGRRGFQEWLAGTKLVSPVIIAAFATALSELLGRVENPEKVNAADLVNRLAYNLWNKLLTHQDFEPLPALIQAAVGAKATRVNAPTIMADLAAKGVQNAGYMSVFAFRDGLISWRSATDSGKAHKRKELSGRARALRFQRGPAGFEERPTAKRLLLVVDGTFDDTDLRVLAEAGWNEIFYPDEMDQLVQAIE